MENIIQYPVVGEVRYVRNNRAKNLSIRINQTGEIRVTVPRYVSMKKAEIFFMSKRSWVERKVEEIRSEPSPRDWIRDGDVIRVGTGQVRIRHKADREPVENAVWRAILPLAREKLPARVEELSVLNGLSYSGVRVRKMNSRWGSCSAKNSINLNSWLVMLPPHLVDYVILHELAHTRHRDHGRRFWELMDQLTGGRARELRREIRQQRIMSIDPEEKLNGEVDGVESPG